MTMNALSDNDLALLYRCVLKSLNKLQGKQLAMDPFIMPFVTRIFASNKDIHEYTARVLEEINKDTAIFELDAKTDYDPKEEAIYNAYGKDKVKVKVKNFIEKTTKDCDTNFFIECPVRFLENKDIA